MELISSINTTITDDIPKIIETPNSLIINTQVYDKSTLQPRPMNFLAWHNNFKHLILKTQIDWNNDIVTQNFDGYIIPYCHRVSNAPSIWVDKEDPTKYYVLHRNQTYTSYVADNVIFRMMQEKDNKISFLQSAAPYGNYSSTGGSQINDMHILCETDNYFIAERKARQNITSAYFNNGYYYSISQLLRISKKSLTSYAVVNEIRGSNSGSSHTHENNINYCGMAGYWYYLESKPSTEIVYLMRKFGSNYQIYKYDATINSLVLLHTYTNTNYRTMSNAIKVNEYYYTLVDKYDANDGAFPHLYGFMRFKLNTDADTVTEEFFPINISDGNYSAMIPRTYQFVTLNSLETFKANGKDYIICTMHDSGFLRHGSYHFHATLRIDETEAVVTDYISLSPGCRGVLYYIKPTTCVFLLVNSFAFYTFDESSERYVLTYNCAGIYKTIGFDMTNRFYALSTGYAVQMLTYYNPVVLKADFAEEIYDKTDTNNVNTTVSYYAKNFANEYISTSVTLTLIGNVVFTDNGAKTIQINTSDTGIATVPVTINGAGRIQVSITQTT